MLLHSFKNNAGKMCGWSNQQAVILEMFGAGGVGGYEAHRLKLGVVLLGQFCHVQTMLVSSGAVVSQQCC